MSGPPAWLWWALAAAVTVGVAAVGVAVVSAGLDWMGRRRGRERAQEAAGAPHTPSRDSRAADPPSTGLREALSASTPQTRHNRSKT